jgi:hypothetical protein
MSQSALSLEAAFALFQKQGDTVWQLLDENPMQENQLEASSAKDSAPPFSAWKHRALAR